MTAALNGIEVVGAEVEMPSVGPWSAWVDLDADTAPTGRAVLQLDDGTAFRGTVRDVEAGSFEGRARVHLVAGNGRLRETLTARHYTATTPGSLILADIATELGEAIDSSVALTAEFESWMRPEMAGTIAVTTIATALGMTWRVLAGGTIWVGLPLWPAMALSEAVLLEDDHGDGAMMLADATSLRPGVIAFGQQITSVTHTLGAGGWRTVARYSRDLRTDFEAAVRAVLPELAYLGDFDATVREQNSDGTLNVDCDDERKGSLGNVPIRTGLPGVNVTVEQGTRCRVRFANRRPYVADFDEGATTRMKCGFIRIRSITNPSAASFLDYVEPDGTIHVGSTPLSGVTPTSDGNVDSHDIVGVIDERDQL